MQVSNLTTKFRYSPWALTRIWPPEPIIIKVFTINFKMIKQSGIFDPWANNKFAHVLTYYWPMSKNNALGYFCINPIFQRRQKSKGMEVSPIKN
jgi:hypothetical protein